MGYARPQKLRKGCIKGVGKPVQTDNHGYQPSRFGIWLTQECKCFLSGAVARDTIRVGVVLSSQI